MPFIRNSLSLCFGRANSDFSDVVVLLMQRCNNAPNIANSIFFKNLKYVIFIAHDTTFLCYEMFMNPQFLGGLFSDLRDSWTLLYLSANRSTSGLLSSLPKITIGP